MNPMLADMLSPIYLGPPGLLVCSVISLIGIILIEGTVLCLLRWAPWKTAFLHAFIVNLVPPWHVSSQLDPPPPRA
jgi:hypothetical protein